MQNYCKLIIYFLRVRVPLIAPGLAFATDGGVEIAEPIKKQLEINRPSPTVALSIRKLHTTNLELDSYTTTGEFADVGQRQQHMEKLRFLYEKNYMPIYYVM